MFDKKLKGHINWIFKLLHFERFIVELIVFVNDDLKFSIKDEFVMKTIMYVSWMENEEKKLKVFQDLKFKLNEFSKFIREYNISVE